MIVMYFGVAIIIVLGFIRAQVGAWWVVACAILVPLYVVAIIRASRISLVVTERDVLIRNFRRTVRLLWSDVTEVHLGTRRVAFNNEPAVIFHKRRWWVTAHAVPADSDAQASLMTAIRGLAPASVRVVGAPESAP